MINSKFQILVRAYSLRVNSKFYSRSARTGFTLIELLIVMGITAVLATAGTISYISALRHDQLETHSREIMGRLEEARTKAINQEGGDYWGVRFESNINAALSKYFIFKGTTAGTTILDSKSLGLGINFTTPVPANPSAVTEIVFNKSTGTVKDGVDHLIQIGSSAEIKNIGVSAMGIINPVATIAAPILVSPNNGYIIGLVTSQNLVWGTAPGAQTYRLQVSIDSGFSSLFFDNSTLTSTSYTVTGLQPYTVYYWRVLAYSSASGNSMWSEVRSFGTLTVPDAPTSFTVSPAYQSNTLSWTPPVNDGGSSIIGYKIYWGTVSGNLTNIISLNNVSTYNHTNLVNGTTYYYQIEAYNAVGDSSLSPESSGAPIEMPNAPNNVIANTGDVRITLTWQTPTGSIPTGYNIYRSTSSGGETLLTSVANVNNYTDSNSLTNGTAYYYKISSTNNAGESPLSAEVSMSPTANVTMNYYKTAVVNGGLMRAWGLDTTIELKDTTQNAPNLAVTGITNAVAVDTNYNHTCAILADHTIKCWGDGSSGKLGNNSDISQETPVSVSGITTATKISVGNVSSCALLSDSTIKCWGYNYYGGLGDGTNTARYTPVSVSGITNAIDIGVGTYYACALLADNTVKCWGYNPYYNLGNGTTVNSNVPVVVANISGATALAVGDYFNCVILSDSTIKCWGVGTNGQLGNGASVTSSTPVAVTGITNAVEIKAREAHACARLADGTIKCWGYNGYGQLGNGTYTSTNTPVVVTGITTAKGVDVGYYFSCATLTDNTVECWGRNTYGQLGVGTYVNSYNVPTLLPGVSSSNTVSGGLKHTCIINSDSTIKCWGLNNYGQLGIGSTYSGLIKIPTATPLGDNNVYNLAEGAGYMCAILADKTVKCWGSEYYLGNGSSQSFTPVTATGITNAVQIASTYGDSGSTCVLLNTGVVECWGSNNYGQLGDGTTTTRTVAVTNGINNATSISGRYRHFCASLTDGTVKCWGYNGYGQVGDGTTTSPRITPTLVTGIANAIRVSVGEQYSCALLADGTIECWGYNAYGQLGNGTTTSPQLTPTLVSGISNAIDVSAGVLHTCALLADKTAKCWGYNGYYNLGDGTSTQRTSPVVVSGLTNIAAIETGVHQTCVMLSNNTLECWGYNYHGEVGRGDMTWAVSSPTTISW